MANQIINSNAYSVFEEYVNFLSVSKSILNIKGCTKRMKGIIKTKIIKTICSSGVSTMRTVYYFLGIGE